MLRKVFLDELPRNKSRIDWCNSVGMKVKFVYDDIEGEIEIKEIIDRLKIVAIYNNKKYIIHKSYLKKCNLGSIIGVKTKEFKIEIGTCFKDDKRDITIIDRKYKLDNQQTKRKLYKYKCNKCPNEDWIEESNLLHGHGCNVCCTYSQKVLKDYNDLATTHPELIKYLANKEDAFNCTRGSTSKIKVKCPDCNTVREISINKLASRGFYCTKCSDGISYPNKFIYNILEQLNVDFEREYHPDWASGRFYDIYIPSINLIIEMDGALGHGKYNKLSKMSSEESKEIDDWKDKQAELHNLKVIRIDCNYDDVSNRFQFIKNNIINSELSNLFDLSIIDWQKANMFSTDTLIKDICAEINKNNVIDRDYLTNKFKISKTALTNYIKIGNELGWCNHNFKIKYGSKKVEVFKDGVSLGVFESIGELTRRSKELFSVNFTKTSVSNVCKGKQKQHHGYTFKFI